VFRWLVFACALSIFGIVVLIAYELVARSQLTLGKFGLGFFFRSAWDPVNSNFGAWPFIYGTLVSSFLALLISVPFALGVAIFLTEMCPKWLRTPLSFLTELLAAIPSVVYGLWAIFVLIPLLRDQVNPKLMLTLGWTGFFSGPNAGYSMLAAGVVLAIMILPIISSLTREVMTSVPTVQREGVLALGATRWEMIRIGVLRNARIGIVGAIILGLGRALGETMAVAIVLSVSGGVTVNLIGSGNPSTIAANIALNFPESSGLTVNALIASGLALFVISLAVNMLARYIVGRRAAFSE
jgi:phosphate transport system permease protein